MTNKMTAEEAKEFLIDISYKLGNMAVEYLTEKDGEKMRKAIEALEAQPCDDVISREQVIEDVIKCTDMNEDTMDVLEEKVRELPPVAPTSQELVEAYNLGYDYGVKNWFKSKTQPCEDCIRRQAVLDVINFEDEWLFDAKSHNADTKIAFSAIKFKISELPSVTPRRDLAETSQDCISREEVQDLISRWLSDYLLDETREALETINYKIGDMPPVNPQRKVGKWIEVGSEDNPAEHHFECSECGNTLNWLDEYDHYCRNCGSKNWEG